MSFPSNMVNSRIYSYYKNVVAVWSLLYIGSQKQKNSFYFISIDYLLIQVYYIPHRLAMAHIIAEKNERLIVYSLIQLKFFYHVSL